VNVGSHIGQYRILKKLGAGGMGAVFLGEHILLGRRAAIKTLLPALSKHEDIADRFFNEARATSAISDHGVVQIFDFGYHVDGTAYIVMELLEGESLAHRIDRLGQLSVGEALRISRQVAASLAVAHERAIIHRDLKPDNIFLIHDTEAQNGERTKILDFGICKLATDGPRITGSGVTVGTPVYMSPEQCRGAGEIDHRSDIYALGCVLFHMLVGRAPFEHDAPGDFLVSHMREEPPVPSTLVRELPPVVDDLLLRCLAKAPEDRFQSMGALITAIEYALAHISAPDHVAAHARGALPLGAGFRSVYDANVGSGVVTEDIETPPPSLKPSLVKFALAAAILLLVIGAIVATRVDIGGTSAVAEPSYRYTHPGELAAPQTPSVAPPPIASPTETVDGDAPPFAELVEKPPMKIEADPSPRSSSKSKSKPRRKAPAPATTPEDLYDTR
jgi:tRNA A-37 threonylcarbamoyl transferase component Bud32